MADFFNGPSGQRLNTTTSLQNVYLATDDKNTSPYCEVGQELDPSDGQPKHGAKNTGWEEPKTRKFILFHCSIMKELLGIGCIGIITWNCIMDSSWAFRLNLVFFFFPGRSAWVMNDIISNFWLHSCTASIHQICLGSIHTNEFSTTSQQTHH